MSWRQVLELLALLAPPAAPPPLLLLLLLPARPPRSDWRWTWCRRMDLASVDLRGGEEELGRLDEEEEEEEIGEEEQVGASVEGGRRRWALRWRHWSPRCTAVEQRRPGSCPTPATEWLALARRGCDRGCEKDDE
ncbi:uncharacterized protein [Triticum aestivum]|uniref:uncharacterized protein n=1 Tax=Triticum aestivum TaxID=4565 RepID=UPI001D0304D5|nr:uncharacterized protein LOC123190064 [Triticum aestivum]